MALGLGVLMKRKIICCSVFRPYIEKLKEKYQVALDIEYLEVKLHNEPQKLFHEIQSRIDQIRGVDEILVMYGLCGNATTDLRARNCPVTLLKVHDCFSILLGGKQRFIDLFSDRLSTGWNSASYRLDEFGYNKTSQEYLNYVEDFGEENADYLMETLYSNHGQKIYLDFSLDEDKENLKKDHQFEVISGSYVQIEEIVFKNNRTNNHTLTLYPNEKIKLEYDLVEVFNKESE